MRTQALQVKASLRGASMLLMCLVTSTLAVMLLLILFTSQSVDLTLQVKSENLRIASLAARNSLELAMAHLGQDRDWGKQGQSILWHDALTPGATGRIRFATPVSPDGSATEPPPVIQVGSVPPNELEPLEEKYNSVNNLGGHNTVQAFGDTVLVPPNAILVVAVGEYRGKRQVAYQIVLGSPLPYSLASEGSLKVSGDTVVGSLDSLTEAQELTLDAVSPDDLRESGLVSNDGSNDAVTLDGAVKIVGNVEAVGLIQASSEVSISGQQKRLDSPLEMPEIDSKSYDPKGDPADPSDDRPTLVERSETEVRDAINNPPYGFHRFSGDVHFPDGVKLDGTGIYVDGNVTFDGPVEGSGVIISTGNVSLNGGGETGG